MNETQAISMDGLIKRYGANTVLDGVTLNIEKGSIFALLGSNGAGKTTMVRILSTLTAADGGTARIFGVDVMREPAKARALMGLTGQYAAVDEMLTGIENMRMTGKLYHIKNASAKIEALLDRYELTGAAKRRVSTYSGGMRRKLDIAMSLLSEPKVLFLDEPTTGLDPQNRRTLWSEIRKLKENGITVFLTTQYLDEAEALADSVAILDKGKIISLGTVEQLKQQIPGGTVVIGLHQEDMARAAETLASWRVAQNEAECAVTVRTDGSAEQLTDVLTALRGAAISPRTVTQKETTLEEVFLQQIALDKGGKTA